MRFSKEEWVNGLSVAVDYYNYRVKVINTASWTKSWTMCMGGTINLILVRSSLHLNVFYLQRDKHSMYWDWTDPLDDGHYGQSGAVRPGIAVCWCLFGEDRSKWQYSIPLGCDVQTRNHTSEFFQNNFHPFTCNFQLSLCQSHWRQSHSSIHWPSYREKYFHVIYVTELKCDRIWKFL